MIENITQSQEYNKDIWWPIGDFDKSSFREKVQQLEIEEAKEKLEEAPLFIKDYMDLQDYDWAISLMLGSPTTITFWLWQSLLPKIGVSFGFMDFLNWITNDKRSFKKRSPKELDSLLTRVNELILEYKQKVVTDSNRDKNKNPNEKHITVGAYAWLWMWSEDLWMWIWWTIGVNINKMQDEDLDEKDTKVFASINVWAWLAWNNIWIWAHSSDISTNKSESFIWNITDKIPSWWVQTETDAVKELIITNKSTGQLTGSAGVFISFISEKTVLRRLERIKREVEKIKDKQEA